MERRLTAIMAADVVEYTRLLSEDESGMLAALNAMRSDVFEPTVTECSGSVIKRMGDGWLVEFPNISNAVNCAMSVQRRLSKHPLIRLRVGIHIGDVTFQDDDIYGDGINVAARLEARAQPGQVLISDVVYHSLDAKTAAEFSGGEAQTLKNVNRLVHVWYWSVGLTASVQSKNLPSPVMEGYLGKPSIAVLPFENMSGDPEQEFFSDGISEDIITDLSKVSGLTVIARNSSFAYKGKAVELSEIGNKLGVTYVLEGSVRRAGARVRITAQLVDTATERHIWAERFDRNLTDIFTVQDEVTLEIVTALKVSLSADERANIGSIGTTNLEAHENYMRLRGYLFFPGMDASLWKRAISYGNRAIELDPGYADAYGMLSIMHVLDYHNHWSGTAPTDVLDKAEGLARRAVELDSEGITANHAVAVVARWKGDYDLAVSAIEITLAKSPDYALGFFTRGEVLLAMGRLQEAARDLEQAIRLDPGFAHQYLQFLGICQFLLGNYGTAVDLFRERLVHVKDTDIGRAWLSSALGHLGEISEAKKVWSDLLEINPDFCATTRLGRLAFSNPVHTGMVMEGLKKADLI